MCQNLPNKINRKLPTYTMDGFTVLALLDIIRSMSKIIQIGQTSTVHHKTTVLTETTEFL